MENHQKQIKLPLHNIVELIQQTSNKPSLPIFSHHFFRRVKSESCLHFDRLLKIVAMANGLANKELVTFPSPHQMVKNSASCSAWLHVLILQFHGETIRKYLFFGKNGVIVEV